VDPGTPPVQWIESATKEKELRKKEVQRIKNYCKAKAHLEKLGNSEESIESLTKSISEESRRVLERYWSFL
jgi:hypothetical protein